MPLAFTISGSLKFGRSCYVAPKFIAIELIKTSFFFSKDSKVFSSSIFSFVKCGGT